MVTTVLKDPKSLSNLLSIKILQFTKNILTIDNYKLYDLHSYEVGEGVRANIYQDYTVTMTKGTVMNYIAYYKRGNLLGWTKLDEAVDTSDFKSLKIRTRFTYENVNVFSVTITDSIVSEGPHDAMTKSLDLSQRAVREVPKIAYRDIYSCQLYELSSSSVTLSKSVISSTNKPVLPSSTIKTDYSISIHSGRIIFSTWDARLAVINGVSYITDADILFCSATMIYTLEAIIDTVSNTYTPYKLTSLTPILDRIGDGDGVSKVYWIENSKLVTNLSSDRIISLARVLKLTPLSKVVSIDGNSMVTQDRTGSYYLNTLFGSAVLESTNVKCYSNELFIEKVGSKYYLHSVEAGVMVRNQFNPNDEYDWIFNKLCNHRQVKTFTDLDFFMGHVLAINNKTISSL